MSVSPRRSKRMTFAIKDFMESETFKVLMQKRKEEKDHSGNPKEDKESKSV